MAEREWNAGDVALVRNEYGIWNTAILQVQPGGRRWVYGVAHDSSRADAPARPLVVIDPEDRDQIERLLVNWPGPEVRIAGDVDLMQACFRELANPTPPIEEPTGLGAVVEEENGDVWIRRDVTSTPWLHAQGNAFAQPWSHLAVARVLSEGVIQ